MILILVRHGQSMADIENRIEGRYDSDLTELGYRQAECSANWLKNKYKISKIITSPLKRALNTAKIISSSVNADAILDEKLMEWDSGILSGMLRSEANEKYPKPNKEREPYEKPYKMESLIEFRARVESFWQEFIHTHKNEECICIVSHGGTIRMLFSSILKLPIVNDITLTLEDNSINIFEINDNKIKIVKLNYTEHLALK